MNLGILIIVISVLGYFSNYLNYSYLNYSLFHWLYYLGVIIHESSHALLCILTGARITKFQIFSKQAQVSHTKSRIPILGQSLISLAPIFGGFLFLYLINKYLLLNYLIIPEISNWSEIFNIPLNILSQINITTWQGWIVLLLSLNLGAMIGPSFQDLKNIWWIFIILFFIKIPFLINIGIIIIVLILTNIIIQLSLILLLKIFKK
jgi:Peptidase M50B-like